MVASFQYMSDKSLYKLVATEGTVLVIRGGNDNFGSNRNCAWRYNSFGGRLNCVVSARHLLYLFNSYWI